MCNYKLIQCIKLVFNQCQTRAKKVKTLHSWQTVWIFHISQNHLIWWGTNPRTIRKKCKKQKKWSITNQNDGTRTECIYYLDMAKLRFKNDVILVIIDIFIRRMYRRANDAFNRIEKENLLKMYLTCTTRKTECLEF